jgi:hypothetical protein
MDDSTGTPLMPHSFNAEWNDDRFWYRELCVIPEDKNSVKVASQTEYSLTMIFEEADIPKDVDVDISVTNRQEAGEVIAEVEMVPGKPDGAEYIGVSVMASEMLTQVLYQGVEEFEDIVKAAIITTGNDDYQSLVMKEMFPDSPVPDKD